MSDGDHSSNTDTDLVYEIIQGHTHHPIVQLDGWVILARSLGDDGRYRAHGAKSNGRTGPQLEELIAECLSLVLDPAGLRRLAGLIVAGDS